MKKIDNVVDLVLLIRVQNNQLGRGGRGEGGGVTAFLNIETQGNGNRCSRLTNFVSASGEWDRLREREVTGGRRVDSGHAGGRGGERSNFRDEDFHELFKGLGGFASSFR